MLLCMQRSLYKAHSWPPADEAPWSRSDPEAPPLSPSRSLEAPPHGAAQRAQQPQHGAAAMAEAAPPCKGEECRAVMRALYKEQFAGAG